MSRRARIRTCIEPGCGEWVEGGNRCTAHRKPAWSGSHRAKLTKLSGWEQQRRAKRVLARYDNRCHVCNGLGATEVDHVVPLAEGGADDESNLRPIHGSCHREKTAEEAARGRA